MFGVLTLTLHTFLPKPFFPEDIGGAHNTHGNSGDEGLFLCSKNGNSSEKGGVLREIPSVVGL